VSWRNEDRTEPFGGTLAHAKRQRSADHRGNGFPYFPLYPGDWLSSSTRVRLTVEERGAFWDLIFYMWQTEECSLPDDQAVLAAYSGLGERWPDVGKKLLDIGFVKHGSRWVNRRLKKERRKVEERSLKAAKAGVSSGRARRK
jgi:uncharacterized protein YdaU (DUF1376 family)